MKYLKNSETGQIFAYESDGSQDHLIDEILVSIAKSEVEAYVAEKQSLVQDISPEDKLSAFLKANPDVKSLLE